MIILTLCIYINRYLFLAQPSSQKLLSNHYLTSNLSSFDITMIVHANATQAKHGYLSEIRAAECPAWETSYSNSNTSLSRRTAPGSAQNTWLLQTTDYSLLCPPCWLYTHWWLAQKQAWSTLTHWLGTNCLHYKPPFQMCSTCKACLFVHLCSKDLLDLKKRGVL